MNYCTYDTKIKHLARNKKLPDKYLKEIPRSNLYRWAKEDENKYIGAELNNIQTLEAFVNDNNAQQMYTSYLRIMAGFCQLMHKAEMTKTLTTQYKTDFVYLLLKVKLTSIKFDYVLRLLNISKACFYNWVAATKNKCEKSTLALCKRIYPNQLSTKEVGAMKILLKDEQFSYWPVASIAHYALRNNIITASLQTWYRYVKALNIKRPIKKKVKKYPEGIRAPAPNVVWHADITVVKTLDNRRYYIYFLMDNFSRYIINWQISDRVSKKIRFNSIKEAYYKYIHNTGKEVDLIVDGGVENNNTDIDSFIEGQQPSIQKLIALKHIDCSNSLVEAQNKLIKYRYFFKKEFTCFDDIVQWLEWSIEDYNTKRPHVSLDGLIPIEAFHGKRLDKEMIKQQFESARLKRIEENRKDICEKCK